MNSITRRDLGRLAAAATAARAPPARAFPAFGAGASNPIRIGYSHVALGRARRQRPPGAGRAPDLGGRR